MGIFIASSTLLELTFLYSSEEGNSESIGLFGGGIAYPQNYRDDENEVEPWVGFKRSIEQTDLIVDILEKSLSNN